MASGRREPSEISEAAGVFAMVGLTLNAALTPMLVVCLM